MTIRSLPRATLALGVILCACVPGTYEVGPGGVIVTPAPILETGVPAPMVEVTVAPPPPQPEVPPPPRVGYYWIAGRWNWAGGRWAWAPGHFRPIRAGYTYYPGQWVVTTPGRYAYVPGYYRPAGKPPARVRYQPYYQTPRVQITRQR